MRLWCNGKRWGLSLLVGFCICTFCMYKSPCWQVSEMKKIRRECREEWNSPVRGICSCSLLGVSCSVRGYSRSDSILLFVPWDPGSLCKCKYTSATLLSRVTFSLVPVNCHWWVRFFWLVTRTNARVCSSGCYMHHDRVVSDVFSFLCLCFW